MKLSRHSLLRRRASELRAALGTGKNWARLLLTGRLPNLITWRIEERKRERGGRRIERIVVAYDFHKQPLSVGDSLTFVALGLALRDRFAHATLDVAFLGNPRVRHSLWRGWPPAYIASLASRMAEVARNTAGVAQVHLFDERAGFESFLAHAARNDYVWPEWRQYITGEYMHYSLHNDIIRLCTLPQLHFVEEPKRKAADILRQTAARINVTVQLRHSSFQSERNSQWAAWKAFFAFAREQHPDVGFVLIGSQEEADHFSEELPNVLVAKKLGTSLLLDLALVSCAAGHLGTGSGPGVVAEFSDRPYVMWTHGIPTELWVDAEQHGDVLRFPHFVADQKLITSPETPESIIKHGGELLRAIAARHPRSP